MKQENRYEEMSCRGIYGRFLLGINTLEDVKILEETIEFFRSQEDSFELYRNCLNVSGTPLILESGWEIQFCKYPDGYGVVFVAVNGNKIFKKDAHEDGKFHPVYMNWTTTATPIKIMGKEYALKKMPIRMEISIQ